MSKPTQADDFDAAIEQARQVVAGGNADLVPLGAAQPDVVRTTYGSQLADATRATAQLKAAAQRRIADMERDLSLARQALQAEMAPLQAMMERLQEGIWTVNLYLGRDEEIELIADGEPAPADTPITLRQLVLAMDEECLVAAETGGIDARAVDDFAAWLTEDRRHLDQVFPEPKGVVVLVPSRQLRDYGDSWMNGAMRDANATSYWLIRNGAKVYLMTTDIRVGDRLLPTRAEFLDFFSREARWDEPHGERIPLEPGSEEWVKAEQRAGARRRHYMRLMLVLQGLADRTTVFQPMPAPVTFLSLAAQDEGRVQIVNELDNVLTTGRPSFSAWQEQLASQLRPGMRIIGAFGGQSFRGVNENDQTWRHSRLHPTNASAPESLAIHTIEDRGPGGALIFRYERTDTVDDVDHWGGYQGQRAPKTRASCTIYPHDDFILPIDLVTAHELETYLHARTERHAYISMVPVIKAALAVKRAETKAEAPFRLMLAGRIAGAYDLDVSAVEQDMPALVDWWKLANRWHRPLVGEPEAEGRAVGAIVREWEARRAERRRTNPARDAADVERVRGHWPNVICVARRRNGVLVGYEPAAPGETMWLTERELTRSGEASAKPWTMLTGRSLAALTLLWSTAEWRGWNHNASRAEHLTGPEREEMIAQMVAIVAREGTPIVVTYQELDRWGSGGRTFWAYAWANTPRTTGPRIDGAPTDPGQGMVAAVASWKRERGGKAVLTEDGYRYAPRWGHYSGTEYGGSRPWQADGRDTESAERLVWSDATQLAKVTPIWAEIEARREARREKSNQVHRILFSIGRRWERAEEQRQYERFLVDYAGATDLWEGHRKTLRINFQRPYDLDYVLGDLIGRDVDLTGMTVSDAIEQSPVGRRVNRSKMADGVAEMLLVEPEDGAADE